MKFVLFVVLVALLSDGCSGKKKVDVVTDAGVDAPADVSTPDAGVDQADGE